MLEDIRTKVRGPWAVAIVLIISIPFIFFGVESIFSIGSQGSGAVSVNGEDFSEEYIQQLVQQELSNNESLSPEEVRNNVVNGLVDRTLLEQSVKGMGLQFSDLEIEKQIIQNPQFQKDGKFSQELYSQFLRGNNISGTRHKDYIKQELQIAQLGSVLSGSDFVTNAEIEDNLALVKQSRDAEVLTLDFEKIKQQQSVSDEELKKAYDENQSSFMSEEQVSLNYIELSRDQMTADVTDEELKSAYDEELKANAGQEKRTVSHIMLTADDSNREEKLKALAALREKIVGGEDFAAVAKANSEDDGSKDKGGNLGVIDLNSGYPESFTEAVVSLKQGELSQPVTTSSGVHLIKVTNIETPKAASFDERQSDLRQQMMASKQQQAFVKMRDALVDETFNAQDLKEPAKKLGVSIQQTKSFGRQSGYDPITKNEKVIQAAFSSELLNDKVNSDVIEVTPEKVVVIRVNQHSPSKQLSFDDVKAQVLDLLKTEKANEQVGQIEQSILEDLAKGETPKALATKYNLPYQSVEKISSADFDTDLPPEVALQLFKLPQPKAGEYSTKAIKTDKNIYLASVSKVYLADKSDLTPEDLKNAQGSFKQLSQMNVQQSFREFLKSKAKIKITSEDDA